MFQHLVPAGPLLGAVGLRLVRAQPTDREISVVACDTSFCFKISTRIEDWDLGPWLFVAGLGAV